MDWMILPLKRYADFTGRSQRMEYWMFMLLNFLVYLVLGAIIVLGAVMGDGRDFEELGTASIALIFVPAALIVLWYFGTFIPNIAVHVRRFHDQNQSGWMYLLNFIPYVGFIVVFIFMLLDGTPGPNRFGEDPKGGVNASSVFD